MYCALARSAMEGSLPSGIFDLWVRAQGQQHLDHFEFVTLHRNMQGCFKGDAANFVDVGLVLREQLDGFSVSIPGSIQDWWLLHFIQAITTAGRYPELEEALHGFEVAL
mmetsp:Transcript_67154/g.157514  ORF Transcript_67154/g.157514 Transcript_67154/m.157514 type:complete len:109 (+) Transcript_67154:452-778(+)